MLYTIFTIIVLVIMFICILFYIENYYFHKINRMFKIVVDEYEEIENKITVLEEKSKKFITLVKKL